jgi:hypothetical protein
MEEPTRSADRMVELLLKRSEKLKAIVDQPDPTKGREELEKELGKAAKEAKKEPPTPIPDTMVYKMMIGFLGGIAAVAAIGSIVLVARDTSVEIPQVLIAVGSAAVGALAGALVPSKGQ